MDKKDTIIFSTKHITRNAKKHPLKEPPLSISLTKSK